MVGSHWIIDCIYMLEDAFVLFRESGIRVAPVNTNDCKAQECVVPLS